LIYVARKFITDEASPFYPPRARWFSAVFSLGDIIRRRLALDRLRMPKTMTAGELLAGFFVPGLAVCFRGPRLWGHAALLASATLLLVYVVWLGYPAANLAFGMLISLHSTGFVYYCKPLMNDENFRSRLTLTLMSLLALMLIVYWPARSLVQDHLLTPLSMNGKVFVVQRAFPSHAIERGDCVAYSLPETSEGEAHNGGAVWFHGGAGLGPILAVAGDHVVFSEKGFSVNGAFWPGLPYMPQAGEWIVPEKHWFIWPNLAISGHGNVSAQRISETMLELADVSPAQYLGRPFHHWFWRQQNLP
jgi:hypothetical protein